MLRNLRHKGVTKKVLWFISGIIIISFGFGFGMSSYSSHISMTDTVGKAFGKNISFKEFKAVYQDTRDQAMLIYGDNFRKLSSKIDLESEAWSRLLMIHEANQRKIKATDAEVIAFIQGTQLFQRDGVFDRQAYDKIIRYSLQREPRQFEEGIRDQIKIMKMFRAETMGLNLTDDAVRKEYERRNQKIKVGYVLLNPKNFTAGITLSDKEIQDYYTAHREDFSEPDSVNIQYATFTLPPKATDADKKVALAKAKAFYAQSKTPGNDFAAAAKTAGAEFKQTGLFSIDQPNKDIHWSLELMQGVFSAKAGDVMEPVEYDSGIQVVKVVEKKPAFIPEFDKAKPAVTAKVTSEKALQIAKDKAAEVLKTIAPKIPGTASFEAAVKALGLEKQTTPFFSLEEYIPEIGLSEDFASAAFNLSKDKPLSNVVVTSRGPAILYWEAIQPIDEKKFEEVKKDFTANLYEEKRIATMNRIIKEIKEKAKLETYMDKIKQKQSGQST